MSTTQRGTYYVEHVRNAVLRTDAKTRAAVQKTYVDMGVMTPEYVAKIENLPAPPPKAAPPEPSEPADDEGEGDEAAESAQRALVASVAARFGRREAEKARRAARRGAEAFGRWVEEFYGTETHLLAEMLQPVVAMQYALRGKKHDGKELARQLAEQYTGQSQRELLDLKAQDLEAETDLLLKRWALLRPMEMADAVAALKMEDGNAA
jgi:hypothetical protein